MLPSAAPSTSAKPEDDGNEDDVRPVYPVDNSPPDPLAQRLCHAIHAVEEERRAACCSEKPGIVFESECVRTLSAALRFKAVTLDAAAVDACVAAVDKTYEGCEWTGPNVPVPPSECRGIVHGLLGKNAKCRSSLECSSAMYCRGVGPTDVGRCTPPGEDGASCGQSVDSLATYVRDQAESAHPVCKNVCRGHRCGSFVGEGGACRVTAECESGKLCIEKTCVMRALPKAGEACPGDRCEAGLMCLAGKCMSRKPAGEVCTVDLECIGACLKPGAGASGKCGRKCGVR
jgi:hypothetical protein